jgi:chromosome segregation ATPase
MEPIRPDDDEVRAGTKREEGLSAQREPQDDKKAAGRKPEAPRQSGTGGGGNPKPPGKPSGGGGSGRGVILAIGLLIVAGAAGAGWYQQEQRIQMLEGQLEEADYWARQSKLALARFEGDLSETGENLQEKGQSIEDRLATQGERLDTADSEIRKLWGVANDRNRKRLDDHQSKLESLLADVNEGESRREALTASVEELETGITSRLEEVEADLQKQITAVRETGQQNASRLTELDESLAGIDKLVERQLVRFEREQKLTIDGLESRIAALENATDGLSSSGQLDAVRGDLAVLEETVSAIDASRSQLTSRLVRLSEEVRDLRSQISGL